MTPILVLYYAMVTVIASIGFIILGVEIHQMRVFKRCFKCYDKKYVRENIFDYRTNTVKQMVSMTLRDLRRLNTMYGTYCILQSNPYDIVINFDNYNSDSYYLLDMRNGFQLIKYADHSVTVSNNGDAIITIYPISTFDNI